MIFEYKRQKRSKNKNYNNNDKTNPKILSEGYTCIAEPNIELLALTYIFFFINNQKFKQPPHKSLICLKISK